MSEQKNDAQYFVVFKTLIGPSKGAAWYTLFPSKEAFDQDYAGTMQDGSGLPMSECYAVVAEGVSKEDASRLAQENSDQSLRSVILEHLTS